MVIMGRKEGSRSGLGCRVIGFEGFGYRSSRVFCLCVGGVGAAAFELEAVRYMQGFAPGRQA